MPATNGLVVITPSSITKTGTNSTATINSNGSVTFTDCESLAIDGVFSSTYDNYLVNLRYPSFAAPSSEDLDVELRMRASGTDETSALYHVQRLDIGGTAITGSRSTARTTAVIGRSVPTSSGISLGSSVYFYGPNLAVNTVIRATAITDSGNISLADYCNVHAIASAYTGFKILPENSPTEIISGLITVFGFNQ